LPVIMLLNKDYLRSSSKEGRLASVSQGSDLVRGFEPKALSIALARLTPQKGTEFRFKLPLSEGGSSNLPGGTREPSRFHTVNIEIPED